jgi:hypothetical protein
LEKLLEEVKIELEQQAQASKTEKERSLNLEKELSGIKLEATESLKLTERLQASINSFQEENSKLNTEVRVCILNNQYRLLTL